MKQNLHNFRAMTVKENAQIAVYCIICSTSVFSYNGTDCGTPSHNFNELGTYHLVGNFQNLELGSNSDSLKLQE